MLQTNLFSGAGGKPGGGGNPHMKGVEMLVGNFELTPKGDRSGRGPSFFLTAKRDHVKTKTNEKYSDF